MCPNYAVRGMAVEEMCGKSQRQTRVLRAEIGKG
jgi:hypothetical protein